MEDNRYKFISSSHVKEEIVPVLIQEGELDNEQYTYATFTSEEETEESGEVLAISRHHDILANAEEVIIDENGQPVTLQELVENGTVEEVETVEEGDGTHTILHIVPNIHEIDEDIETICDEEEEIVDTMYESESVYEETTNTLLPSPESPPGRTKSFYCTNCGNCYSAAGSLKLHMRACMRQRTEVPPEERMCNVCNKVFNSVAYLKEHMMRHTGEKPFRCSRCYRKFIDETKYQAHMESHKHQDRLEAEAQAIAEQHGGRKVVVKEFTCSFCSKNFTVVFEVGQVKRRYACDECREKYSNEEALRQHKAMVEEKREFCCQRCGRKFVFEGFLQRHYPSCDGSIKRRRDMK